MKRPNILFWRSVIAFVAMPGIVAFGVPVVWLWSTGKLSTPQPWGLLVLALGVVGLLWCVRDFYIQGKGTLAPWSPPGTLVVMGLYRYSRNPMYVCVLLTLLGWATAFSAVGLLVYVAIMAVAFHLRVVRGEEPWLAQKHGIAWQEYSAHVPRWIGPRPK